MEKFFNEENDNIDVYRVSLRLTPDMTEPEISINGQTLDEFEGKPSLKPENGVRIPFVDKFTEGNELKLYFELPGAEKENIKLYGIEGGFQLEAPVRDEFVFEKEIFLDEEIDLTQIKASFTNGILEIIVPIKEEEKKKITIE